MAPCTTECHDSVSVSVSAASKQHEWRVNVDPCMRTSSPNHAGFTLTLEAFAFLTPVCAKSSTAHGVTACAVTLAGACGWVMVGVSSAFESLVSDKRRP